MEYRSLGNTGLKVSALGLGGNNWGVFADEAASLRTLKHAMEVGINFFDTADHYSDGKSEEIIGKAIKGNRSQVIIATKVEEATGKGPNDRGTTRHHIMQEVERSLTRLQTDYIDLYQIHWPDRATPIEETLRTLDDLVRSGKVRYVGCSNFNAWQLCEALFTSKMHNLNSFVTAQKLYNPLYRQIEAEFVPCCQAYNIGIITYNPLAAGFLTGKYKKGESKPKDARLGADNPVASFLFSDVATESNWDKLGKLEKFAEKHGRKVNELTIAWLVARSQVSSVIAGSTKPEQVDANIKALDWKLTSQDMAEIDKICPAQIDKGGVLTGEDFAKALGGK